MDIKMPLTEKQYHVLDVIRDFYLDHGFAPSLTELQKLLDITTKRGVVSHLKALEKKGFILRTGGARGIEIVGEEEYDYLIGIPILGYANAGIPIAIAEEQRLGQLQLDTQLIKSKQDSFALIVKGDSMDQKSIGGNTIENGKYIIVSRDSAVENGDVAVVIIDGCATVKTIQRQEDMVVLYPESSNPVHKPIYLSATDNTESMINGKVIMVLNNPSFK